MSKGLFGILKVVLVAVTLLFTSSVSGQTEESRWGDEHETKTHQVVLTRRTDNGAYGTSAFSFRKDTQDVAVHRNYVDLVFNGCGHLHFNPVSGTESRVADLGESEDLDVEYDEDKDHTWATQSFPPEEGHVYLHKVKCLGQTMIVKYHITEVSRDQIKLNWQVVRELDGTDRTGGGMGGTMGQCGGPHRAR